MLLAQGIGAGTGEQAHLLGYDDRASGTLQSSEEG